MPNHPAKDLSGTRFNYWTVLERANKPNTGKVKWRVMCVCGNIRVVNDWSLKTGDSTNCGCIADRALGLRVRKHGKSETPEYKRWTQMLQRCNNPRNDKYEHYGGRGIKVCDRWRDFANYSADMGQRPSPRHSVERIDNNGPYSPENCRWALKKEQQRNTRATILVAVDGEKMCLKDAAAQLGWDHRHYRRIISRLFRGWTLEQAMTTPAHQKAG